MTNPEGRLLSSGRRKKELIILADCHYSLFLLQRPREVPSLALKQVPKDLDPKAAKAMVYAKKLIIVGLKYLSA